MNSPELPIVPAVGLRRLLYRMVDKGMSYLPATLRQRWGWWSWKDVFNPRSEYLSIVSYERSSNRETPVARLLRRGIEYPVDLDPWPLKFDELHNNWNFTNDWYKIPFRELSAWIQLWSKHPQGGRCLDIALVGVVGAGFLRASRALLAHGANPLAVPDRGGTVMEKLWSMDLSFSKTMNLWQELTTAAPDLAKESSWSKVLDVRRNVLYADQLEWWKNSGLPLPTHSGALSFARALVYDVELGVKNEEKQKKQAALAWWLDGKRLLPRDRSKLLQTWLSTARPGADESYQKSMSEWGLLLLPEKGLPPRPEKGPSAKQYLAEDKVATPWSHWAVSGPFFENLPVWILERLFDEPDAWTAKNGADETVSEVITRKVHDARGQSRDEGLSNIMAFEALHKRQQLMNVADEFRSSDVPEKDLRQPLRF